MTLSRMTLLVAVLMLAICVPASAQVIVAQETTHITGLGGISDIQCDATVTKGLDGIYTYEYLLTYLSGIATVKTHRVQNPNFSEFFDAANTPLGEPAEFDNIAGTSTALWASWTNGWLQPGQTRTFSYKSAYKPQDILVWEIVIDGGSSATGHTIGMGDVIPEPASMAALLMGFAGLVPLVIRRRK